MSDSSGVVERAWELSSEKTDIVFSSGFATANCRVLGKSLELGEPSVGHLQGDTCTHFIAIAGNGGNIAKPPVRAQNLVLSPRAKIKESCTPFRGAI